MDGGDVQQLRFGYTITPPPLYGGGDVASSREKQQQALEEALNP